MRPYSICWFRYPCTIIDIRRFVCYICNNSASNFIRESTLFSIHSRHHNYRTRTPTTHQLKCFPYSKISVSLVETPLTPSSEQNLGLLHLKFPRLQPSLSTAFAGFSARITIIVFSQPALPTLLKILFFYVSLLEFYSCASAQTPRPPPPICLGNFIARILNLRLSVFFNL